MTPDHRIPDSLNEQIRPLLIALAKRNQIFSDNEAWYIKQNVWAASLGDHVKCLVCGSILDIDVYAVRLHGFSHVKEHNLLPFF